MTRDELLAAARAWRWYHRLDLGDGFVTDGYATGDLTLQSGSIPEDLTGMRVLDLGTYDGLFAFEAERRGAGEVVAVDRWDGGSMRGFLLAREILGSRVKAVQRDIYTLTADELGTFDLVICCGLLYHLPDPLLALRTIRPLCYKQLVLETHLDLLDVPRPAMAFYPGDELAGDPSNWCGPNPACVEAMLRVAGWASVEQVAEKEAVYPLGALAGNRFRRGVWVAGKSSRAEEGS